MPFFLKSCLKLRKSKEKKNKKLNQCIIPFSDITTPVRIDNVIQHCEPHPSPSNLFQYDEMNNPDHLVANNASVNETTENLEQDVEENDTDEDISGNDLDSQKSEDTRKSSQLHMCSNSHLNVSDGTPECRVFRTDSKQKCKKKKHDDYDYDDNAYAQNSEDSMNKNTKRTLLKSTVSEKKKSRKKKNKKIDQCIRPFCDCTTPVINVKATEQCKTKLGSSNVNKDGELYNLKKAVENNASVKETLKNSHKDPEEFDTDNDVPCDDFDSQNSEDSANKNRPDMCAKFHLSDSDGPQEVTVVKTANSKKKNSKKKKYGYDSCDNFKSQISEDSETNSQGDLCAGFPLNDSVGHSEVTIVKTGVSSEKNDKNRKKKKKRNIDQCITQFSDCKRCTRNEKAIQKGEDIPNSPNLNKDHEMKRSDHSVASCTSNNEKTENSENTVQERDIDDIDSCDEIGSQNSENSDNKNQAGACAELHSNDSERTTFNAFVQKKDTFQKIAVPETTIDYRNSNELLDAHKDIDTITVTRRIEVLVPDDILENIYIEKSCEIVSNITVNSDVVGIIEELNTIDDVIKKLHQEKKLEEPIKLVQDVNVDCTQDENVDSHKDCSIDSKKSDSCFNRESQSPSSSKDTLPSILKIEENQALLTKNMIIENELEEKLDSRESPILESNSSFANLNGECLEVDHDPLTAKMESSKVRITEIAKHRNFRDSDSESRDSSKNSKTESEILEVDTTVKIEKQTFDTEISQISMKNDESNLPAKEAVFYIHSKNSEDKREDIIHPNKKIDKSGETNTKKDALLMNIVENVSGKFRNSKEEVYCENDFEEIHGTDNNFVDTQANSELNNFKSITHNTETSTQSIFRNVNVQFEIKSAIHEEEKIATETVESQTALSADMKEGIDLPVYQASESIKSEMILIDNIALLTEETRTVEDTCIGRIPEKQPHIIYLIHSNTKPDELPLYKIQGKPVEGDNIKSREGCSEADSNFIGMRNCAISSKSDASSSIPQIQKMYSENNISDYTPKDIINKNDLFDTHGKGDSSRKHDANSNLNLRNKEIFICSVENEYNKLHCKQKEKLESIFKPSKNETNFMNAKENLKEVECKASQTSKEIIFDSNIEKVAKEGLDVYDTRKKGCVITISPKSAGDVPVINIKDLQNCETILHSFQDKSSMLGKQGENIIFENKIFDESQENASDIIDFDDDAKNEIYINDNKYSQTHSDHFKDSSERKIQKPLLVNFQNSYSIAGTQRDNPSLTEKVNKMLQNSADSLFVNVESIQENDVLSEDSLERTSTFQKSDEINVESIHENDVLSEDSLERTSTFQKSDETISPYSSQEYIQSQRKNSSLQCFNENYQQVVNAQCGVRKQIKPGNSRIELNDPEIKEKYVDDAMSYRNKNALCSHSLIDLDNGNSSYLAKHAATGNSQSETPEYNFLEEDNTVSPDTLQKHKTHLVSENKCRVKSASNCSLLECSISTESSKSENEDVKKQELKFGRKESFISNRREDSAGEKTLPDEFKTLLNFKRNRRHSEKSTKLKNTFTIQNKKIPKTQSRQKLEIRSTKIRLQKTRDETAKIGVMHNSNKHTKIYTNLPTKKGIIKNNSPNIKTFSRFCDDRTPSNHKKSSLVENKKLHPSNSVQSNYLHEVAIESFKEYSIPMTPVRRKILDSSRSIRSPKYPSPLKSKRTDKKESFPLKQIFLKQKGVAHLMLNERNIHKLNDEHEIYNPDSRNVKASSPRKRLTEDGNPHQIQHTQNYRAISPHDLKSKFDDVFKEYAGKGRCNRHLISFQRSTKLLQDAGVIGKMLTADEATDSFKSFAGVKVTLNKEDYRHFLMKLTRKKRLNYNEVYEKLCNASDKVIGVKDEFF